MTLVSSRIVPKLSKLSKATPILSTPEMSDYIKTVPSTFKCLSIEKTYRGYVVSVKEITPNGNEDPVELNLSAFLYLKELSDEGNIFFYDHKCDESFYISSIECVKKIGHNVAFYFTIISDLTGNVCYWDIFFESFLNMVEHRAVCLFDENIPFSYGTFALFALSSCLFASF